MLLLVDSQHTPAVRLVRRENWRQFSLLVLVNAFVGGMVGLERTVVPLIGSQQFGLVLKSAIFSFIVSFGVVKACSNLISGTLADRVGRKKVLLAGWVVGVPVPFMIAPAPQRAGIRADPRQLVGAHGPSSLSIYPPVTRSAAAQRQRRRER